MDTQGLQVRHCDFAKEGPSSALGFWTQSYNAGETVSLITPFLPSSHECYLSLLPAQTPPSPLHVALGPAPARRRLGC